MPRYDNQIPPPFLEAVQRTENWSELINLVFPGVVYHEFTRIGNYAGVFIDPVICRLYESLYRTMRDGFVCSLANEFYQECIGLPDGACIVDAGCGPGMILTELARLARDKNRKWRFLGFDPSAEMIHIASERQKDSGLENVRFVCTKGSSREGREILSQASMVLMRNVLSWVENVGDELSSWKKILPKGATLLSREVRRDIPFTQMKRRLIESCQFQIGNQTLYYPVKAYLTAYLRAFTPAEHKDLLSAHFSQAKSLPPRSCLAADKGKVFEAEMQLRCCV